VIKTHALSTRVQEGPEKQLK